MALNLASPGIVVREVDLTIGRVDATSGSIGALVAPFTKGPVEEAQLIESEEDLLQTFGQPYSVDKHYEYWMVASSYLAYGGVMQVIRASDTGLKNAYVGILTTAPLIKSETHYNQLGYDDNTITGVTIAAKTPGSYANGIRVSVIDAKADQVLTFGGSIGISTVGVGITQTAVGRTVASSTGTKTLDGYIKGVVTAASAATSTVEVKVLQHVSAAGTVTNVDYAQGGVYNFLTSQPVSIGGTTGNVAGMAATSITSATDWFESQNIELTTKDANGNNIKLEWDQLADAPGTSSYAAARGGRFDEVHVLSLIHI